MKVTFTEEMIQECESDKEISMVAFGQEELRDISILVDKTIEISESDYLCEFDDEYGNLYFEIEVDGEKYNVPAKYFED